MRDTLLLSALGLLMMISAPAQTTSPDSKSVSEPEFADVFYRLDAGKLVPLERQAATMHGQAHGFIVMSMKTASEFPGSKSPIRFSAGQRLDFVVRSILAASMADPNATYCLRRLNSKQKTRELVTMAGHVSPVGMSTKMNLAGVALPVEFSKYGNSSFKMTTAELAVGEYAIGRPYGPAVFCFGID